MSKSAKLIPVENRAFGMEILVLQGDLVMNRFNVFSAETLLNELYDYRKRMVLKPVFQFNTTNREILNVWIANLEQTIEEYTNGL